MDEGTYKKIMGKGAKREDAEGEEIDDMMQSAKEFQKKQRIKEACEICEENRTPLGGKRKRTKRSNKKRRRSSKRRTNKKRR